MYVFGMEGLIHNYIIINLLVYLGRFIENILHTLTSYFCVNVMDSNTSEDESISNYLLNPNIYIQTQPYEFYLNGCIWFEVWF